MQEMTCLILEDEPLAVDVLKEYIKQVPGLKLNGSFADVFRAGEFLRANNVDLLFVDINLPRVNGLDFIKSLQTNYHVILTTAYHQYALDGFNLNVVDYLLKPIELSRFLQAVNKVFERAKPITENLKNENFYFFNVDKRQVKIFADDILYIESIKDYVRIHTTDQKPMTKFQIGELENYLKDKRFIRIHKSYLINSEKITTVKATEIELGAIRLPVGRTYKQNLKKILVEKSIRLP